MLIGKKRSAGPRSFQNGRYLVRSLLGEGSTGLVYEVSDQELDGERLALKLFHPELLEDEAVYERLRKQILLARQLSHPNIVQVYDFDRDELGNYLVTMELVSGMSLDRYLKENSITAFSEALILLSEIAKGLAHAHSSGMIHRELTPANVLLSVSGQIKISDFGIAQCFEDSLGLTVTGELVTNTSYSSPERLRGEISDTRSDVYSFGMLAFQLVTGKLPFEQTEFFAQAEAHLTQALPELRAPNGEMLPLWFHDFVAKCCEKQAKKRFESAVDLSIRLEEQIRESKAEIPQTFDITFLRNVRKAKRFRIPPLIAVLLLLSLLTIAYVVQRQTNTRRFIGVWTLRAEKVLGFELTFLKRPFHVSASVLRPRDFLDLLDGHSQPDGANVDYYSYIEAGGDLSVKDAAGNGILHLGVLDHDLELLLLLKAHGYDVNQTNGRGETAFLRALRLHLPDLAGMMTGFGVNPNICDNFSVCPIHLAVQNGYTDVIDRIGFWGGDITARDANGLSVIHILARDHDLDKLSYLAERFSKSAWQFDCRDRTGMTPLMLAVSSPTEREKLKKIVEVLRSSGARLESRDDLGRTPLMHALLQKNAVGAEVLLALGADSQATDGKGKSARVYAEEVGLFDLLK